MPQEVVSRDLIKTTSQQSSGQALKARLSWKPATLQPKVLLTTVAFACLLVATLEYLSRLSDLNGGIFLSNKEFPSSITFASLYLPTIIAVIFAMVWTWIDLDARRLEPFFQLSRASGVAVKDSLDLRYPFDFTPWASCKALKRGHWSVVFATLAMMVILWAVTPLLSAVVTTSTILQAKNATMTISGAIAPFESQMASLTTAFMMTAYGVLWLGQPLPGFVTDEFAILPFTTESIDAGSFNNATLTSTTTAYRTSLHCEPAQVLGNGSYKSYSNGKGCVTEPGSLNFDETQNFTAVYIGWSDGQFNDWALSRMGCSSRDFLHTFLAFWGTLKDGQPHITALFCEPTYAAEMVNVTVSVANHSVIDVKSISSMNASSLEHFNTTNFEYILSTGFPLSSKRADIPDTLGLLDQQYRLQKMGNSPNATVTNIVGYALGATQYPIAQYMDADILASAFEKAHKILFALAVQSLMSPADDPATAPRYGIVHGSIVSLTINRTIALATEILLGLLVLLALALILVNWRRSTGLGSDPSSIGDVLAMLDAANNMLRLLDEGGNVTLDQGKLRLIEKQNIDGDISPEGQTRLPSPNMMRMQSGCNSEIEAKTMRPNEMRLLTGFIFLTILVIALTTVVALRQEIVEKNGLSRPSTDTVGFQILTRYIPVLFATFLEPFWTLLNRILCMLKPFDTLRSGDRSPSRSIYLRYSSLPPPLVIWRALRARHFLLVAVCAIGLSTNVLAVALGGLFQTNHVILKSRAIFNNQYAPFFRHPYANTTFGTRSGEPFYIAKSNISNNVPLPPWISKSTFFLPFDLVNTEKNSASGAAFQATTMGFGANLTCHEAPQNAEAYITQRTRSSDVPWNASIVNGKYCTDPLTRPVGGQNKSNSAVEIFHGLASPSTGMQSDDDYCETAFIAAFIRGNLTVSFDYFKTDNEYDGRGFTDILAVNTISSTWMICQSTFLAASYEVIVDSDGYIQNATRQGDYISDVQTLFADGLNATFFMNDVRKLWSDNGLAFWHNDTFVDSWFGYLTKTLTNSSDSVNPNLPVPDFQAVAPVVEDMFARIFAIWLSLNTEWLAPAAPNTTLAGSILTAESRVFMSTPAFIVTVTLLSCNIIVALLYYRRRPKKMLKRMPTNIASILELFNASGLVLEASSRRGQQNVKKSRLPEDMKLGYGRFVGTDGKPHIGVERRPFVVPWGDD